jgi:hypothetical protein
MSWTPCRSAESARACFDPREGPRSRGNAFKRAGGPAVRSGWRGQLGSVCMAKALPWMFGQRVEVRGSSWFLRGSSWKFVVPAWKFVEVRGSCVEVRGSSWFLRGSSWFLRGAVRGSCAAKALRRMAKALRRMVKAVWRAFAVYTGPNYPRDLERTGGRFALSGAC